MQEQAPERLILVIDLHQDHANLVRQILSERYDLYQLQIIESAEAALERLNAIKENYRFDQPDLILLDLNLPDQKSLEILTALKTNSQLQRTPVIVLSASERPEDVLRSYLSRANCYVVKAADSTELTRIIKRIEDFWLEIVTLPLK